MSGEAQVTPEAWSAQGWTVLLRRPTHGARNVFVSARAVREGALVNVSWLPGVPVELQLVAGPDRTPIAGGTVRIASFEDGIARQELMTDSEGVLRAHVTPALVYRAFAWSGERSADVCFRAPGAESARGAPPPRHQVRLRRERRLCVRVPDGMYGPEDPAFVEVVSSSMSAPLDDCGCERTLATRHNWLAPPRPVFAFVDEHGDAVVRLPWTERVDVFVHANAPDRSPVVRRVILDPDVAGESDSTPEVIDLRESAD